MGEKYVANVIFAAPAKAVSPALIGKLKDEFDRSERFGCQDFKVASTIKEIDSLVQTRRYDVLICFEELVPGTDVVGKGSIKSWKKIHPFLKVILLMKPDKKGAIKVRSLFEIGEYNGLFLNDFNFANIERLVLDNKYGTYGRTALEASEYYGIDVEATASLINNNKEQTSYTDDNETEEELTDETDESGEVEIISDEEDDVPIPVDDENESYDDVIEDTADTVYEEIPAGDASEILFDDSEEEKEDIGLFENITLGTSNSETPIESKEETEGVAEDDSSFEDRLGDILKLNEEIPVPEPKYEDITENTEDITDSVTEDNSDSLDWTYETIEEAHSDNSINDNRNTGYVEETVSEKPVSSDIPTENKVDMQKTITPYASGQYVAFNTRVATVSGPVVVLDGFKGNVDPGLIGKRAILLIEG